MTAPVAVESLNLVSVASATTGTSGPITLGAAVPPYQTEAAAGAVNGSTYRYIIAMGGNKEIATGAYTSSGRTIARISGYSSTGSPLNLDGTQTITFVEGADDIMPALVGSVQRAAVNPFGSKGLPCDGSIYTKSSYTALSAALGSIADVQPWTRRWPGWVGGAATVNGAAYGASIWVVVGNSGVIFTSTNNGDTWTQQYSGTTKNLNAVIFANSTFVAVGASGAVLTSPDGITWTVRTGANTTSTLNCIAYDGTYFFVGTSNGASDGIWYSSNTTSWSVTNIGAAIAAVAYGASTCVAINAGTNSYTATAGNGAWSSRTNAGTGSVTATGIIFANSLFIEVGSSGIYSSADGITWTQRYASAPSAKAIAYSATYGFVVGINGSTTASTGGYFTSTNGTSWTQVTTGLCANSAGNYTFGIFANSYFMFGGAAVTLGMARSADASAWFSCNISASTPSQGPLAYNGSVYVAGTTEPLISSDLVTWKAISNLRVAASNAGNFISTSNGIGNLRTGNGYFLVMATNAAGTGYFLYTSPDGINWTARTLPTAIGIGVPDLATDGAGNWVMAGGGVGLTTATYIFFSSDNGATWAQKTNPALASNTALSGISYGGGVWVIAAGPNQVWTSPDGSAWTARTGPPVSATVGNIAYGNSMFLAATSIGLFKSTDSGVTWTACLTSLLSASPAIGSGVVFSNGLFAIGSVSNSQASGLVTLTPDGSKFWQTQPGVGTIIQSLAVDGTNLIVFGNQLIYSAPFYSYNTSTQFVVPKIAANDDAASAVPVYIKALP